MNILILLNGRSVSGIYNDVIKQQEVSFLPQFNKTFVVTFAGDNIAPPAFDCTVITIQDMKLFLKKLSYHDSVWLVANGGITKQLVPVLSSVVGGWSTYKGKYSVIDLQRDHISLLEHRDTFADKPASEYSEDEAYSLYHHTSW